MRLRGRVVVGQNNGDALLTSRQDWSLAFLHTGHQTVNKRRRAEKWNEGADVTVLHVFGG